MARPRRLEQSVQLCALVTPAEQRGPGTTFGHVTVLRSEDLSGDSLLAPRHCALPRSWARTAYRSTGARSPPAGRALATPGVAPRGWIGVLDGRDPNRGARRWCRPRRDPPCRCTCPTRTFVRPDPSPPSSSMVPAWTRNPPSPVATADDEKQEPACARTMRRTQAVCHDALPTRPPHIAPAWSPTTSEQGPQCSCRVRH